MLTIKYKINKKAQFELAAKAQDAQACRVIQSNGLEDAERAIALGATIDAAGDLSLDLNDVKVKLLDNPWSSSHEDELDQAAHEPWQVMDLFEALVAKGKEREEEKKAKEKEASRISRRENRERLEEWLKNPSGEIDIRDLDENRVQVALCWHTYLQIDRDDAFLDILRATGDRLKREAAERSAETEKKKAAREEEIEAARYGYASFVPEMTPKRLLSGTIPKAEMNLLIGQGMYLYLQGLPGGEGWLRYQLLKARDTGCDCHEDAKFWSEEVEVYPPKVWDLLQSVQVALKNEEWIKATVREHFVQCSCCTKQTTRYSIRMTDTHAAFHISLGVDQE